MVYLIHFRNKLKHAQHYIGYCRILYKRVNKHKANNGAKLLRAVNLANIDWFVVRTWSDGDRKLERQLKNKKKSSLLCPICNKKLKLNRHAIKALSGKNAL